MLHVAFQPLDAKISGALVVGVYENNTLSPEAETLNSHGLLSKALTALSFTGKESEAQGLALEVDGAVQRVVALGLGDPKALTALKLTKMGGSLELFLSAQKIEHATLALSSLENDKLLALVQGVQLKNWRFDKYHTQKSNDSKRFLKNLDVRVGDPNAAEAQFTEHRALMEGVSFSRTLISEPANVVYPASLAEHAKSLVSLGVEVEILDVEQMKALGMNALLGVGQGSTNDARLIVARWTGHSDKKKAPIAVVGKGVTFDTGGISIKPSSGMDAMKTDMSGGAVVLGLVKALALRKAKVNVVGVVGAVENMPSGTAQRPGDVVVSMSGQTIEVLDTDAEGRLVLADALWYAQKTFSPEVMVDLATLTGAIQITFGSHHAGLFSNDDTLSEQLTQAGQETGERVWRLPLSDECDKEIDSDIADVKNLGAPRSAGSIAAAQFLQRFVNKKTWAHLDIAGVSWLSKDTPFARKGATAFGVRLLNTWIQKNHETA